MSKQVCPKAIYKKYLSGDPLTDKEVIFGVTFYKNLADNLVICGPAFSITFKETNRVYMWLFDIQSARGLHNGNTA